MTHTVCDNETTPVHRVMEEIEEVVGDKTTVEADDLDKLTYMNQVNNVAFKYIAAVWSIIMLPFYLIFFVYLFKIYS